MSPESETVSHCLKNCHWKILYASLFFFFFFFFRRNHFFFIAQLFLHCISYIFFLHFLLSSFTVSTPFHFTSGSWFLFVLKLPQVHRYNNHLIFYLHVSLVACTPFHRYLQFFFYFLLYVISTYVNL